MGEHRQQTSREAREEKEREIRLSQNQFPRPRVHFINQHTDIEAHTHTHTMGWLGLLPNAH